MVCEFGELPVAQRRRSSVIESRVVDAVLDVIPTAEPRMDEIAAKIRPILQTVAVQASPVQQADTLSSLGLKRSMQFLTKQLDERTEELSSIRVELSCKKSDLVDVTAERDKCMAALEEAHECVSDYHRKLAAMERTVGQALVSKGEIKDLTAKLEEAKGLNTQYREALTTAEMRIESLQDSNTSQQDKIHSLEEDLLTWKSKAERSSHDASESSRRIRELDSLVSELKTRLADAESQKNTVSEEASELDARHNETLAALNDMITIQKRSDSEREDMAETLQTQQRCITQHEATIEALRAQLEVAHHQPLCASADAACAGTSFLDGDRSTCMRALDRAATTLEVSLPALSSGLMQLANHPGTSLASVPALRPEGARGTPSPDRTIQTRDKKMKLEGVNVEDIIKELQKLHDVIHAACMFNNQEDDYKHTLYKALRDLWGSLEQSLSCILPPLATITQVASECVSEAHRRENNLREALQDTHDALGRTASDRQRTKEQLEELQQQLSEEQQKASDEAREAAVQAQTETLKHTSDNQRLSVRAEAAESDAKRSQQECQRLHAEYDHKVHALEAGMRARFSALRESYQQQLDALHMQVIEMHNQTSTQPKPRLELPSDPFPQQVQQLHRTHPQNSSNINAYSTVPAQAISDQATHGHNLPMDTEYAMDARQAAASSTMHGIPAYVPSTHSDSVGSYTGERCLQEEHHSRNRAHSEAALRTHTHPSHSEPTTATPEHPYPHTGPQNHPHLRSSTVPCAHPPSAPPSEPSLRDNVAFNTFSESSNAGGGAGGTSAYEPATNTNTSQQGASERSLGGYQDTWPVLDAPPPPFAEPRSDSGYLSGAGAAQPGFKWGIQVPTDPGDAAVDAGSGDPRSSFSFAADLPDDPLPDTTHLNGPSAPPHVLSRQAQTYHSPGTTMPQQHAHYSQLLSPPSSSPNSHAHMHDAHAHAHSSFQGSTHMQRSNLHTGFVSQATSVADFRPEHSHSVTHQPAWMHGVHGMHIGWSEAPRAQHQQQPGRRGRVEGWSRPQSAQPGGFNREEPPASAEAVYLASQHAGTEGAVRPQSAKPSDHWTIQTSTLRTSPSPAKSAAGRLQPNTQHIPRVQAAHSTRSPIVRNTTNSAHTPRPQRCTAVPKAGKSPRASKPPAAPSPASVTEEAVMSALKKAGVLDRLGATSSSLRRTSTTGKVKSTRTSSTGRGRSRTPKQSNWLV